MEESGGKESLFGSGDEHMGSYVFANSKVRVNIALSEHEETLTEENKRETREELNASLAMAGCITLAH